MGIGKQLWANRSPRSLPCQYPRLASRFMPGSAQQHTVHSHDCYHTQQLRASSSGLAAPAQCMGELTRCLILSALVSSVPQARLLHLRPGQVRPASQTSRTSKQPDPADTRLTRAIAHDALDAREVAGTVMASSGNLAFAQPGNRGSYCLGSHSPFDLCNGAMSCFQNSSPTSKCSLRPDHVPLPHESPHRDRPEPASYLCSPQYHQP